MKTPKSSKPRPAKKKLPRGRVLYVRPDSFSDDSGSYVAHASNRHGLTCPIAVIPRKTKRQAKEIVRLHEDDGVQKMRSILNGLLKDAKAEAYDVLSDPSWNSDYFFGFKLTVKQLREIAVFLNTHAQL